MDFDFTGAERPHFSLPPSTLLSQADMAERWGMTLQAVQNRKARHEDFPPAVTHVSRGKVALYYVYDVIEYEHHRGLWNGQRGPGK